MATEFDNIKGSMLPYNQQEIEVVMKQMMLNNGITDVLYEGSNVSQLTSIVSYIISSLNVNTAINLQETILPLATKRMNILFGSRQLGYEPHAVKSYIYELTLKPLYDSTKTTIDPNTGEEIIDTNDTTDRTISIMKNTKFTSGDKSYYYVGPTLHNVITVSNYDIQFYNDPTRGRPAEEITLKIPVVEGNLTTYLDDPMLQMTAIDYQDPNTGEILTKQDYLIGYDNVEDKYGLQVFLSYIDEHGYQIIDEEWKKSEYFLIDETLDYNDKTWVRKENIILGYPVIFFKFAGFGNGIRSGTQIKVNVLQSSGVDGMATDKFLVDDVVFNQEMEVISYSLLESGRTEETDEEIKNNAIVFKNTGNRAVTRPDYISITKKHPLVKEADAWGGEDETPKAIGNIWISCTPAAQNRPIIKYNHGYGYEIDIGSCSHTPENDIQRNWRNWYLTDEEYNEIISYLDVYKIMTMQINYRHPLYINFDYIIDIVKYDLSKSPQTTNEIAFNALNNYFTSKMETYNSEYLTSNIQRILDTELNYNTGVNISTKITGTLCTDMLDKFYKENYNRDVILASLSWPYENILTVSDVSTNEIITDRLPRIDGSFGVNGGYIKVNYDDLQNQLSFRKVTKIYYTDSNHTDAIIGEYIVDIVKGEIDLTFEFNLEDGVDIETIFGPEYEDANGDKFRQYTEFQINYYPFDSNQVNIAFGKNRIPRLRKVEFTTV